MCCPVTVGTCPVGAKNRKSYHVQIPGQGATGFAHGLFSLARLLIAAVTSFFSNTASVQLGIFVMVCVGLWTAEALLLPTLVGIKLRHSGGNALFIVTALPIQMVMVGLCLTVSRWTELHHWGLVYFLPEWSQPVLGFIGLFVLLDMLDYVYHVCMHKVPVFWKFHSTHHRDNSIDVSTTVREHPGETVIRNGFLILWVVICGAPAEVLILRQTVESAMNLWSHSAIRLPSLSARVAGWLIVTPNFHHVHHHARLPFTDRNYGDVFSIWDRLFGTLASMPQADIIFGLEKASAVVKQPLAARSRAA
jgi:sterol desaturase/sphingolipid hydroxylase (fatty acid hydroxylase superfamily)